MTATWFISDLHLDPARVATSRALARFLSDIRGSDALYILGDLFEAWPGDDDDSPLAETTRKLLKDLCAADIPLYLLHGNRDFLLGEAFCAATGATLLSDPSIIDLYGTPTLVMHGDSLCTADEDYQAFRQRARQRDWQEELMSRPLAERRALAAELRRISHEAISNKPEDIIDVCVAEVERIMAAHGVNRLIHGHTHRPGSHAHKTGERWVLGDWDRRGRVLKVEPEEWKFFDIHIY